MLEKSLYWGKIIVSQIVAFVFAGWLTTYIFVGPTAIIRPEAKIFLNNLPQAITQLIKNAPAQFASAIPAPWVNIPQKSINQSNFPTGIATSIPQATLIPTSGSLVANSPTPRLIARIATLAPLPTFAPRPPGSGGRSGQNPAIPTVSPIPLPPADTVSLENQIISLINARRSQDGLGLLSKNNQLTAAARRHSSDISRHNNCGHYGSDGSDPFRRAREAGFTGSVYGETVACRHTTPESAVAGWWSSPPHHAILTNGEIKQIGVGWAGNYQTALVAH